VPNLAGAGWISSSLAVWAGFFFLYVFFPNRRVRFEAAAVGSLVASILLQFAQWAFIYFQYGINSYAAIYGALASIPVLLTWIYMTWVIVLLGAEVTAAFERRDQPLAADHWAMSERVVALAVALWPAAAGATTVTMGDPEVPTGPTLTLGCEPCTGFMLAQAFTPDAQVGDHRQTPGPLITIRLGCALLVHVSRIIVIFIVPCSPRKPPEWSR